MLAKKSGKYLEPANKSLQKGIQQAQALNARGRTNQFIVGALGGGVAEGVFRWRRRKDWKPWRLNGWTY